jgi:hypothetical protein
VKNITLTLLAAAAIGAISIGSASAMPYSNVSAAVSEHVQDVRVVCNQYRRCYSTARTYRYARAPRYYNSPAYYPGPGYAYYGGPSVGIGIGPFGFGVW